ncbi:MAG: hypothetical protein ABFQ64_06045 [Campylobacterota bacterium]
MNTYKTNKNDIENFLRETITNTGDLSIKESSNFDRLYEVFPSLELVYYCDNTTYVQISHNIYRDRTSVAETGSNREYLLTKINFDSSKICISQPYISSATGRTCITVAKEENNKIYMLDFDLNILLQRLGLIEINREFNFVSKAFYFITANVMILLALFTIGYALFSFIQSIFVDGDLSIESIFKPVIALTLGLAIFDLAKTVMEQEVVFKTYSKNNRAEYKVLIKFSITIIIALLIESLMVVFKIAIDNYTHMLHALYLVGGVSILMVSLGLFIHFTKQRVQDGIRKY